MNFVPFKMGTSGDSDKSFKDASMFQNPGILFILDIAPLCLFKTFPLL